MRAFDADGKQLKVKHTAIVQFENDWKVSQLFAVYTTPSKATFVPVTIKHKTIPVFEINRIR